jgi:hypothetical protein
MTWYRSELRMGRAEPLNVGLWVIKLRPYPAQSMSNDGLSIYLKVFPKNSLACHAGQKYLSSLTMLLFHKLNHNLFV